MQNSENKRMSLIGMLLFLICLALPFLYFFLVHPQVPVNGEPLIAEQIQAAFPQTKIEFKHIPLLPNPENPQQYANVVILENKDKPPQIVTTNSLTGYVELLSQSTDGWWTSTNLNPDNQLPAPAQVTPVDLDGDGDRDFVVSCIGGVIPTDDKVGRVVWLENIEGKYTSHDLLTGVRRVSDAQCADFDGDGDLDMVVAVFGGFLQGQILYLENDGEQNFTDYELMNVSGTIHVPVADFDGDGDLDFAAVVSQEEEEVWGFENPGDGFKKAKRHQLFLSWNFDLGTSGMKSADMDGDGDEDLVMALGDNLELINNAAQPWHGVRWLENKGDWKFKEHTIANIGGVYGVSPCDLDNDGDMDVAVVTMFNDWTQGNAASVLWLENDGQQKFTIWQISDAPIQLASVDCGDINGDGLSDIVTGSFHFRPPFRKMGTVNAFLNSGGTQNE